MYPDGDGVECEREMGREACDFEVRGYDVMGEGKKEPVCELIHVSMISSRAGHTQYVWQRTTYLRTDSCESPPLPLSSGRENALYNIDSNLLDIPALVRSDIQ